MREFTCIVCGKKSIDKSPSQSKIYCSRKCIAKHWYEAHKDDHSEKQVCKYNEGVDCFDGKCESCGWNPEVAKKRTEAFL